MVENKGDLDWWLRENAGGNTAYDCFTVIWSEGHGEWSLLWGNT